MALKLDSIVPWGRNIDEYTEMFLLSDEDLKKRIAGFGDGPASFNYQATMRGYNVTSFDPIYCFSKSQLEARINEVRTVIMKQMSENKENYIWNKIKSLEELESIRMASMMLFLQDYEKGLIEKRYVFHELPDRIDYPDDSFEIGLSSHFLLMYTSLGYDFHIAAISEMLRLCKQVRIFPLCDLDSNASEMIERVIDYFSKKYNVVIRCTDYEFQKDANKLLIINK
ncbi:SAM-dependent methyltransferase [uncultured Ruminococcus sp.]|uniref:SAM-dependent methyltransferase n=1 Tax=uncultured Ruminococcus sp. TaxID=165186 RepID=UPI0025FDD47C|nr:SAM-dependent methyltransferase [uncultured Ruminococcus sp.]